MPRHPKPPELRQRRNKSATRAKLRAGGMRPPSLPLRGCGCGGPKPPKKGARGRPPKPEPPCSVCDGTGVLPWHHMTKVWWARLWASPMASQYIESDVDGLYMLASLKDAFWCGGGSNSHAAGEIRQQEARFGMTPLDRRRLEWELEKPSEDEQPDEPREPPRPVIDPRSTMRLVG